MDRRATTKKPITNYGPLTKNTITMPSFTAHVEHLAQRQHRRMVGIATCWAFVAGAVWFALLIACDCVFNPESLGSRLFLSAIGMAGMGFIALCWWRQVSRNRKSRLAFALQMESHYPELRNVAASALCFAEQQPDDPRAGSESLRRAIVLRADAVAESIDWQGLLPARPFRIATRALTTVLLVLLLCAWLSPQTLSTGWQRLILPFGSTHWPRENDLEFVEPPEQILAGATLELTIRDSLGPLPEDTKALVRQRRGGGWQVSTLPLTEAEKSATARLANVRQDLEYRAAGGDHRTMPWRKLAVIVPPRVTSMQVSVQPPAYTEIEPFDWQPGLQLLESSRMTIEVTFDQTIHSAKLIHQDGRQHPSASTSSGYLARFQIPELALRDAGGYRLEFVTNDHLKTQSAKTLSLEVVADEHPSVRFANPLERRLTVTPSASVSIELEARDDLALNEIGFALHRAGGLEPVKTWTLWQHSSDGAKSSARASGVLELSEFGLSPGDELFLHGWAQDLRPQSGQTAQPLSLRIVSAQELLRQLSELERRIQTKLRQALGIQMALHARISEQLDSGDPHRRQFRTRIHSVLFGQRRIASALHGETSSVHQLAEEILRAIGRNHLSLADTEDSVRSVRDAVDSLATGALPAIETSLTAVVRTWDIERQQKDMKINEELASCNDSQQQVINVLQRLLRDVSDNTDVTQLAEELRLIEEEQQELAGESERLLRQWLSKSKLPETSETRGSATQQRQLARKLSKLSQRMQDLAKELAKRQPNLSQKLNQACSACQNARVKNTMYDAAKQLSEGRLSNSNQLQRKAASELRKLNEMLSRQGESKADSRATAQKKATRKGSRPSNKPGANPSETMETTSGNLARTATRDEVAALVDALWGHLPVRQRQQILQPLGDDFLPEYAEDIEAYFRSLAEPDRNKEQSP